MQIFTPLSIITQVLLDPVPPPEPDPRPPPPPPPEPQFPAPAGPQVFVVRRGVPGAGPRPPPPVLRQPIQAHPLPAQPLGILQEILCQQQVLRLQQEALQQQQQQQPPPVPAAQGAPEVPLQPADPAQGLPDVGQPPADLNALQACQLDWQQQQHLHRQQLQPFLADQQGSVRAVLLTQLLLHQELSTLGNKNLLLKEKNVILVIRRCQKHPLMISVQSRSKLPL